jgi:hypothetical protein
LQQTHIHIHPHAPCAININDQTCAQMTAQNLRTKIELKLLSIQAKWMMVALTSRRFAINYRVSIAIALQRGEEENKTEATSFPA